MTITFHGTHAIPHPLRTKDGYRATSSCREAGDAYADTPEAAQAIIKERIEQMEGKDG